MADGAHTRQMTLQEMAQQLDGMRTQQSELKGEIGDPFSEMKADLLGILKQALKLPEQTAAASPSASATITSSPSLVIPPDPPDIRRLELESSGKGVRETDNTPLLPNGSSARLTKIGFPIFNGTSLDNWVSKCEQFFSVDNTSPELKVRLASVHLEDKAMQWHKNYMHNRFEIYPSWTQYVMDLSARFGKLVDDPLSELVNLKQSGESVEVYLDKFEAALARLSLPEPHALSIFLANMDPYLALHARQFKVTTLHGAARIAMLHESSLQQVPSKYQRAPFSPYQNYNDQPYYEREFDKCPEIEFDRGSDEIKDEKLQDKQPEENVKTLVISENEQSLECVGDEPSGDEKPGEVIVEEMIDKSIDMIQEENSIPENESSPIVSPQILLSQIQVPFSSMEPSAKYLKESLVVVSDMSYDLGCVISKTNGCNCDSELGQANSHDEKEFKGLNLGKLLRDEWLLSIVCLLGLNDMSCWTQLLRQQIFPKSWRFKFKTESSGEAILLNTYRAVCLGCCCYEYKNQMLLLGYHGLEVQVLSCLQEFGEGSKTDTRIVLCWEKLASFLWFLHGKKLLDAGQKMQSMLVSDSKTWVPHFGYELRLAGTDHVLVVGVKQFTLAAAKFHLKHKWRSKFGSSKLIRTWTSYSRYDSSSCALRQEENYVLVLFIIIEAFTLFNDQHTLVAEKNGTETSIVLKQIFGTSQDYYLLLFLERVKATFEIMLTVEHFENPLASIFTYEVYHLQRPPELIELQGNPNFITKVLVQWKEHPPDQFFSGSQWQEFNFSSLRTRMFRRGKYCDRIISNPGSYKPDSSQSLLFMVQLLCSKQYM